MNPMKHGSYEPDDLPSGVRISMRPGDRYKNGSMHKGYDFAAQTGTKVYAAVAGIAETTWDQDSYGPNTLRVVQTEDRSGGLPVISGTTTWQIYGHMSKRHVSAGDSVSVGQLVGEIGSLGNSTGPHLHFDARIGTGRLYDTAACIAHKSVLKPPEKEGAPPTWETDPDTPALPSSPSQGSPADPGAGSGDPHGLGKGGSFEVVKSLLNPLSLRDAIFNAPMADNMRLPRFYKNPPVPNPNEDQRGWLNMNEGNGRGWIVRDPVAALVGAGGGYPPSLDTVVPSWQDTDGDGVKDPDQPGVGTAVLDLGDKYITNHGFRFLMNPSSHVEQYASANVDTRGFLIDTQRSETPPIVVETGVIMTVQLLLDRQLDHWLIPTHGISNTDWTIGSYGEQLTSETLELIWKYGTLYDIDFLHRTLVPAQDGLWHGRTTADFGFLIPYPIIISIGDSSGSRRIRGSIISANFEHEFFAPGMVPLRTMVSLTIRRGSDAWWNIDNFDARDHRVPNPEGEEKPPDMVVNPHPGTGDNSSGTSDDNYKPGLSSNSRRSW